MNRKPLALACTALFLMVAAQAQTLNDPFYVNLSLLPQTPLKGSTSKLRTNFIELNAAAPPVALGKTVKWFNSVYYRNSSLSLADGSIENHFPNTLHEIRLSSILRWQAGRRIEIVAIPRVMLRSDLRQSLSDKDLFAQAVLLGNYAIKGNPNFRIGAGLALNNDFERNAIIPIGSLYYDSKRFRAEIVYPNAHFLYKQSNNFEFGLFASVDGAISRISTVVHDGRDARYFRSFQLLVAPALSHRLFGNLFAHVKAGIAPVRYYEYMDADFKPIQRRELENAFFARAGISLRIKN